MKGTVNLGLNKHELAETDFVKAREILAQHPELAEMVEALDKQIQLC